MRVTGLPVTALAAVLLASGAQAASITNLEATPQTIKVIAGDKEHSYTLQPSESVDLTGKCNADCMIALQNGDEFPIAENESASLENGMLYFDPPVQGSAPAERDADQPK